VPIYGVARTVADCFRFRNTVGLDVALEALTDAWRSQRLNVNDLSRLHTGRSERLGSMRSPEKRH